MKPVQEVIAEFLENCACRIAAGYMRTEFVSSPQ